MEILRSLTNAPSTFQLTMNEVFRPLLDKCIIVYLDDILVYITTREQHLKDLEANGPFCHLQDDNNCRTDSETGIPSAIISDRVPRFTSNFWTKTWQQYSTRLHLSTAYHPHSDGQTERTNQTMEQQIHTTCTDPAQREDALPLIEFAYNNAPSATTTQSPFIENLRQSQQKVVDAILKASQRAKQQADRRRRDLTLGGDSKRRGEGIESEGERERESKPKGGGKLNGGGGGGEETEGKGGFETEGRRGSKTGGGGETVGEGREFENGRGGGGGGGGETVGEGGGFENGGGGGGGEGSKRRGGRK
ncbi:hypothetical protein CLOM_g6329, partial [Closterium sp. NIES-68]